MKKLFYFVAVAALTACSNEPEISSQSDKEIRLTTSISPMTRSTSQTLQSVQIESGRTLGIFSQGAKEDQSNSLWTVGNSGTLSSETPLYWANTPVTITAYHPYIGGYELGQEYLFRVQTNQSEDDGYLSSDLLWAQQTGTETTQAVSLNFTHCLTKINISLSSAEITDFSGAVISLCGTAVETSFNTGTGEINAADGTTIEEITAAVTGTEGTASAIIVPQTVTSGTAFVKIQLGSDTFYYKLPSDKTFNPGNAYSYRLNLSGISKEVTCLSENITDWVYTEEILGEAEKENGSTSTAETHIQFDANLEEMTYSGELNGNDIVVLRQMMGGYPFDESEWGRLRKLDISNATIVSGGAPYYYINGTNPVYTKDNIVSEQMFFDCKNLEEIFLPNGVTRIESAAFYMCGKLQKVTMPDGIIVIDSQAFDDCRNLSTINIPANLTFIGHSAFGFSAITSLVIPNGVTEIGGGAFHDCLNLSSVVISDNLKHINELFYSCTSLKEVTIGSGVEEIGYNSFANAPIETIHCKALTPPTLDSQWAGDTDNNKITSNAILYVPIASVEAYRNSSWGEYFSNIEGE